MMDLSNPVQDTKISGSGQRSEAGPRFVDSNEPQVAHQQPHQQAQQNTQLLPPPYAVSGNALSGIPVIRPSNEDAGLGQSQCGIPFRPVRNCHSQQLVPQQQQQPLEEGEQHRRCRSAGPVTPELPPISSPTTVSAAATAVAAAAAAPPSNAPIAYQPPPPYPYPSHSATTAHELDRFATRSASPPIALSHSPNRRQSYPPAHQIPHPQQALHQQVVSPQPELGPPAAAVAGTPTSPLYAHPSWPPHYNPPAPPMAALYGTPIPGNPHTSQVYSFVPIPGTQQAKRPRRRYEEIERIYHCGWHDCPKAYGTLNHLNAHVMMQSHGPKRTPEEFKEIRKEWKARKKEEETRQRAAEERERQASASASASAAAAAAMAAEAAVASTATTSVNTGAVAAATNQVAHPSSGLGGSVGDGSGGTGDVYSNESGGTGGATWRFEIHDGSLGIPMTTAGAETPGAPVGMEIFAAAAGPGDGGGGGGGPEMGRVTTTLMGTEHGQSLHHQSHQHLNRHADFQG